MSVYGFDRAVADVCIIGLSTDSLHLIKMRAIVGYKFIRIFSVVTLSS